MTYLIVCFSADGCFRDACWWNISGLYSADFSPLDLGPPCSCFSFALCQAIDLLHTCWDEYSVPIHCHWNNNRYIVCSRQHIGVLGCRDQHHFEKRHELLSGVPGCSRHPCGLPRHPLRHNHQHRHQIGLLRMSFPRVFCVSFDPKLNIQPTCDCHWSIFGRQNFSSVSISFFHSPLYACMCMVLTLIRLIYSCKKKKNTGWWSSSGNTQGSAY